MYVDIYFYQDQKISKNDSKCIISFSRSDSSWTTYHGKEYYHSKDLDFNSICHMRASFEQPLAMNSRTNKAYSYQDQEIVKDLA